MAANTGVDLMADPITLAVVGGTVGAATSDDPLKGALLGAAGGYAGGALLGTSAATGAAATSSATGAATGATSPLLANQAASTGATGFGGLGSGFSSVGMPEMVAANPFSANPMFAAAVPSGAEASLGAKVMGYGQQAMSALNSNPKIAAMGLGMMKNAMTPPPMHNQILQGRIERGQIQAPQFPGAKLPQRKPVSLLG